MAVSHYLPDEGHRDEVGRPGHEAAKSHSQMAQTEAYVGSIRAGEDGGIEIQEKDNPEGWMWTDSPTTNRR